MRTLLLLIIGILTWATPPAPALAGAYFSDGYLGLTREELRAQLGPPSRVRDRGAALRVYKYYPFEEWENIMKDQMPNAIGEDVYFYVRDKVNLRYSFQFVAEYKPNSDTPAYLVKMVEIEFLNPDPLTGSLEGLGAVSLAIPLANLPALVPEFKPSLADDAPTYRSNLFVIFIQNEVSKDAQRLIKDRQKGDYAWALSYRLYTSEILPSRLTVNDTVNRMEITVDSVQLIKDHHKLTHDVIINPYSAKAASLPPPSPPPQKTIPKPRYAP